MRLHLRFGHALPGIIASGPAAVLCLALCAGAATQTAPVPSAPPAAKDYEAVSLFGDRLVPSPTGHDAEVRYEEAKRAFAVQASEETFIWLGRRAAYLGRYREAIAVFTEGLAKFPASYRLLRHRGHRYISVRQFVRAADDLEKAAALVQSRPREVEPDGVPNKAGIPLSNTQFNIYYHLGLARYLAGDPAKAEAAYRECLKWSDNDDLRVAVSDWLYLTFRRAGKDREAAALLAPVRADLKLVENEAYEERLRMYRGQVTPEAFLAGPPGESEAEGKANFAIRGYGSAQALLWKGERSQAKALLARIVQESPWAAFAAIAAEADLFGLTKADLSAGTPAELLRSWSVFWNSSDLGPLDRLFVPEPTYFSSEKVGLISGLEALRAHHAGFGFVSGGKAQDSRLWLEGVRIKEHGEAASATATWFFDRDVAAAATAQRGPVSFILVRGGDGWRIAHAHFGNDPVPKS